jgi:hypothetical protein
MYLACHIEQEIGDEVELTQEAVNLIIDSFRSNSEIGKTTKDPFPAFIEAGTGF